MPDLIQIWSEASMPRGNKLMLTKIRVELFPPPLVAMATTKSSKIFITESSGWISRFFHGKVPHVIVYQIKGNYDDIHNKIATRGKGPISLYDLHRNS